MVDHADGDLVGDERGEGLGVGVAGDGDHVEADRADGGHRFELRQGEVAAGDGVGQGLVFADCDEGAGEAADAGTGEGAALLDGVVEQGQRGGRAGGTESLDAHRLEDLAHGIAHLGSGSE